MPIKSLGRWRAAMRTQRLRFSLHTATCVQDVNIFGETEVYCVMIKVFLLGRPGSGKTTAFHYIERCAHKKNIHSTRFREYKILYNMFQTGHSEFREAEHGGFDIVDFSVVDKSAKQLEDEIQRYTDSKAQQDELLFIELVRENYEHSLHCFSDSFLQDSYVLFIEADLETCIQRIHYR